MLKIGCHLSASKGFCAMAEDASYTGSNVFQFFTRNPRGGAAKAIDEEDVKNFLEISAERGISHLLAHAPYTINPCSAKPEVLEFARNTMADDLRRMDYVPGNMYNFHPGSHVGQGIERGIELISETLNMTLYPEQQTTVLLETMAGKGSEIGSKFEELREIIDRTELDDKLGVCLDTCHVYDGGYDVVNDLDGVLTEFDRVIGLKRLKAVHINDSKNPFMSHKDRHEVIGGGSLGLDAFKRIINHPALRELPFYLETPNDLDGYKKEIELLRGLYGA
ncbi:MAG: deoxyribonuclease IV [Oscillospiraceae bacterium]